MRTALTQAISCASFFSDWKNFVSSANEVEKTQANILDDCLRVHPFIKSKREFLELPLQDYHSLNDRLGDWRPKDFVRFQPTSGSGAKEKIIPYNQAMIQQFQKALNPWLFDLFTSHKEVLLGRHYWSLSWLPTHWREKGWELDDTELLPKWKRHFIEGMMAAPAATAKVKTLPACQYATLVYLVHRHDLTFLSVWSPTFILELLKLMEKWSDSIARSLSMGHWDMFQDELTQLPCPKNPHQAKKLLSHSSLHDIWEKLALISSWDSSTAKPWAKILRDKFPRAKFSPKGLWATEGVITIPFQGQHLLSYQSHYYEFQYPKSGEIVGAHRLKEGDEVYPLLTTPNGFVRYLLGDRVAVSGRHKQVPVLEFLGRDGSLDLAGEKMTAMALRESMLKLQEKHPELIFVCAFAMGTSSHPHYLFLFEGSADYTLPRENLRQLLAEHFHYQLARELGQLGEETIIVLPDAYERYHRYQINRGMVAGNIKAEVARVVMSEDEARILYDALS